MNEIRKATAQLIGENGNNTPIRDSYLAKEENTYENKLRLLYLKIISDLKDTIFTKPQQITFRKDKWKDEFTKMQVEMGKKVIQDASNHVAHSYNIEPMKSSSLDKVISWLETHTKEVADSIVNTTDGRIKAIVALAVADKIMEPELIVTMVTDALEEDEDYRVNRITDTELITIYSQSALQTFKDNKIQYKIWVTANDERTCEVCYDNDNVVVEMDKAFPSGDFTEPAHPQCRCSTLPTMNKLEFV